VKKQKEITYVKLLVTQQQYKAENKPIDETKDEDLQDLAIAPVEIDEDPIVEDKPAEDDQIESKPDEEDKQPVEEEVEPVVDDREEENHEQYVESEQDDNEEQLQLYDPNETREIEVNSKNKATSLKKIILESIGLFKKAGIVLYKLLKENNPEKGPIQSWVQFSEQDYDAQVKSFAGTPIAFKVYMDITVAIDGRGQSYKCQLRVDPKEQLESTLKQKTHFWKTFMSRGGHKCIVVIQHKNEEDAIVAPDFFKQSF